MRRITIDLSEESIAKAIAEIEAYKAELERKVKIFLSRLIESGYEVADATLTAISDEEKGSTKVTVVPTSDNSISLVMDGEKFLFVEFGAGIAFSQPQNPMSGQFKMGLGTYPGQIHAYQEEGWWYTDPETNESKHSRGNAPYMPMYKADVEILRNINTIAKEVFGG